MDSNNIDEIVNLIAESTSLDAQEIRECIATELSSVDAIYQNDYLKGLSARLSNPDKPINSIEDVIQLSESVKKEQKILSSEELNDNMEVEENRRTQEINNLESTFHEVKEKNVPKENNLESRENIDFFGDGFSQKYGEKLSQDYFDKVYDDVGKYAKLNDDMRKNVTESIIRHEVAEEKVNIIMREQKCSKEDATRIRIYKDITNKLIISYLRDSGPTQQQLRKYIIESYKALNYSDEDIEKYLARIEDTKGKSREEIDAIIDQIKEDAGIAQEKDIRRIETFAVAGKSLEEIFEHENARDDCDTKIYNKKAEARAKIEAVESANGLTKSEQNEIIGDIREKTGAEIAIESRAMIKLELQVLKCEVERLNSAKTKFERKQILDNIAAIKDNIKTLSNGIETEQAKQKNEEYSKLIEQIDKLDSETAQIKAIKDKSPEAKQMLSILLRKREELTERREFVKAEYSFEILQGEKIRDVILRNRSNALDEEIKECRDKLKSESDPLTRERLENQIKEKEKQKVDCTKPQTLYRMNISEEEQEAAKREVRTDLIKQSLGSLRTRTTYASSQTEGLNIDDPEFIRVSIDVLRKRREVDFNLCQLGVLESERSSILNQAGFLTPKDRMTYLLCKMVGTIHVADEERKEESAAIIEKRRYEAEKMKNKIDAITRIEKLQEEWVKKGIDGDRLTRINDAAIDLFKNEPSVSMNGLENSSFIKKRLDDHGITEEDKALLMELFNCVDTNDDRTETYGDNPDKTIEIKPFRASLFTDAIKVNEDRLLNSKKRDEFREEYQKKVEEELISKVEEKRSKNQMLADITTEVSELGIEEALKELTQSAKTIDSEKSQSSMDSEMKEQ